MSEQSLPLRNKKASLRAPNANWERSNLHKRLPRLRSQRRTELKMGRMGSHQKTALRSKEVFANRVKQMLYE
jgi:hypothetical protein